MEHKFFFFFFQAEDGIRDTSVTGVQTCALPILTAPDGAVCLAPLSLPAGAASGNWPRSEERRVGKEGRSRWGPDHQKKKTSNAEAEAVKQPAAARLRRRVTRQVLGDQHGACRDS